MESTKESTDNDLLAASCGKTDVACCKKGRLFLPRAEYDAIVEYLAGDTEQLREFTSRVTDHGNFLLYDQQAQCQFLRDDSLCELHPHGIKPTECFWWPAHVYKGADATLEIRVATCCAGCKHLAADSAHITTVAAQAEAIGHDVLRAFRTQHSYGEGYRVVRKL